MSDRTTVVQAMPSRRRKALPVKALGIGFIVLVFGLLFWQASKPRYPFVGRWAYGFQNPGGIDIRDDGTAFHLEATDAGYKQGPMPTLANGWSEGQTPKAHHANWKMFANSLTLQPVYENGLPADTAESITFMLSSDGQEMRVIRSGRPETWRRIP